MSFELILRKNRTALNQAFEWAKMRHPALSPEDGHTVVLDFVLPVFEKMPMQEAGLVDLFQAALNLWNRGILKKYAVIGGAWQTLLPKLQTAFAASPKEVIAHIANAVYNLEYQRAGQGQAWVARLSHSRLETLSFVDFRRLGVVAAWRLGGIAYREVALAQLTELPVEALNEVMGFEVVPAVLVQYAETPWFNPDQSAPTDLKAVGGFKGFGGVFTSLPQVVTFEDRLLAKDEQGVWEVQADAFGTQITRTSLPFPSGQSALLSGGIIIVGDRKLRMKQFPQATSFAATSKTWAVTLPDSYHIFLMRPPF